MQVPFSKLLPLLPYYRSGVPDSDHFPTDRSDDGDYVGSDGDGANSGGNGNAVDHCCGDDGDCGDTVLMVMAIVMMALVAMKMVVVVMTIVIMVMVVMMLLVVVMVLMLIINVVKMIVIVAKIMVVVYIIKVIMMMVVQNIKVISMLLVTITHYKTKQQNFRETDLAMAKDCEFSPPINN